MALRIRTKTDEVVCAAEQPPAFGDYYIDDRVHHILAQHFLSPGSYVSMPVLCHACQETPNPECRRCKPLGLYEKKSQLHKAFEELDAALGAITICNQAIVDYAEQMHVRLQYFMNIAQLASQASNQQQPEQQEVTRGDAN